MLGKKSLNTIFLKISTEIWVKNSKKCWGKSCNTVFKKTSTESWGDGSANKVCGPEFKYPTPHWDKKAGIFFKNEDRCGGAHLWSLHWVSRDRWILGAHWPVFWNQWAWGSLRYPVSKTKEGGGRGRHRTLAPDLYVYTYVHVHTTQRHVDTHMHTPNSPSVAFSSCKNCLLLHLPPLVKLWPACPNSLEPCGIGWLALS